MLTGLTSTLRKPAVGADRVLALTAVMALGKIGARATAAVPTLTDVLAHASPPVPETVPALLSIDPGLLPEVKHFAEKRILPRPVSVLGLMRASVSLKWARRSNGTSI
jgi:hypothetical protein